MNTYLTNREPFQRADAWERQDIRVWSALGYTQAQIARGMGMGPSPIGRWMKRAGVGPAVPTKEA